MKTYELISDDVQGDMLLVTEGEKVWWVTPNSDSPRWAEYLRYTAWVEAGNNPEDFWTRDLDSPEGLEQVSEPKEEGEG